MAGLINNDDIALVRERANIVTVVSDYVTLRPAGGDSMKGLCPFHDEKTPSFQVTPSKGLFYCFGCGEGGDVITFLRKVNNLDFIEAVQMLADKFGVQLRQSADSGPRVNPGARARILAANQAAADFYASQIEKSDKDVFREFAVGRGFNRQACQHFGMGYAPLGGRALHNALNQAGFDDKTLVHAGLIRQNGWDYFQGRVIWPIRDSANSVLGFGARRVFDDDRMPAKYLNTPETPVYKKSNVLYGLDLARRQIGKLGQAVIVEGYTDVMAAHLSGVETAVASCGTAFGEGHARLIRRLMGANDAFHGEVIFTFDGDAAGQKAALKVFDLDQEFTSQTYVAVEPSGLDPCDLRIQHGEAAVRELIGRRVPLYRFVMGNIISKYDLDRAEGRVEAVREASTLLKSVRDQSLVSGYLRELTQMVGMDPNEVRTIVSNTNRQNIPPDNRRRPSAKSSHQEQPLNGLAVPMPDRDDRRIAVERGTLKLMLQAPTTFDTSWNGLAPEDFTHPAYRMLAENILRVGYQPGNWPGALVGSLDDEMLRNLQLALVVEQVLADPTEEYASAYVARLKLITTNRKLADLRSKLQRLNPLQHPEEHKKMFSELLTLETDRRNYQAESVGVED